MQNWYSKDGGDGDIESVCERKQETRAGGEGWGSRCDKFDIDRYAVPVLSEQGSDSRLVGARQKKESVGDT